MSLGNCEKTFGPPELVRAVFRGAVSDDKLPPMLLSLVDELYKFFGAQDHDPNLLLSHLTQLKMCEAVYPNVAPTKTEFYRSTLISLYNLITDDNVDIVAKGIATGMPSILLPNWSYVAKLPVQSWSESLGAINEVATWQYSTISGWTPDALVPVLMKTNIPSTQMILSATVTEALKARFRMPMNELECIRITKAPIQTKRIVQLKYLSHLSMKRWKASGINLDKYEVIMAALRQRGEVD